MNFPRRFFLNTKTSEEDLNKLRASAQKMRLMFFLLFVVACVMLFEKCERGPVYQTVGRHYDAQALEYKVSGKYEIKGKDYDATHLFKLGELQDIEVTAFSYEKPVITDHGEDVKLHYLPPDKLEFYYSEYLKPRKECPASFMHHNQKIYLLIGANETLSKTLREYPFHFSAEGVRLVYHGHLMNYDSSLLEGESARLLPTMYESAYSNVGFAKIPYEYFLVTGIGALKQDEK